MSDEIDKLLRLLQNDLVEVFQEFRSRGLHKRLQDTLNKSLISLQTASRTIDKISNKNERCLLKVRQLWLQAIIMRLLGKPQEAQKIKELVDKEYSNVRGADKEFALYLQTLRHCKS